MSSVLNKSDKLLKEINHTIQLGDTEYKLAPVNLNVLSDIEDEFGCGLTELEPLFKKKQASTMRTILWIFIKNHDENDVITREEIGKNVSFRNLSEISDKLEELINSSMKGIE